MNRNGDGRRGWEGEGNGWTGMGGGWREGERDEQRMTGLENEFSLFTVKIESE